MRGLGTGVQAATKLFRRSRRDSPGALPFVPCRSACVGPTPEYRLSRTFVYLPPRMVARRPSPISR